ncbi:MAG: hypothetical protein LBT38_03345 [Deltaproteobacteria bacterium]|jgi:hypothetical protein|nr:hypothetical protein [Deltaproteobacteria bacterium]
MFLSTLALCLGLIFLSITHPLRAQELGDLDSVTPLELAQEAPLTEADIDLYLKYFRESIIHMREPTVDMAQFNLRFLKDNNLTLARLRYLLEKIPPLMVAAFSDQDSFGPEDPPYLKFSASEKKLIKANMNKITLTYATIHK